MGRLMAAVTAAVTAVVTAAITAVVRAAITAAITATAHGRDLRASRRCVTETIDVRIDSIAAGGDGVGRHNGIVVFVPRTAPGDLARVHAVQDGRLMRGRLLELI